MGRFLEHPRVFCFGQPEENGDMDDMKMYIASADWMTRNTENRVEVAAPIFDSNIKKEIWDMLQLQLSDNTKARNIDADGEYYLPQVQPGDTLIDAQARLMEEEAKCIFATLSASLRLTTSADRLMPAQRASREKNIFFILFYTYNITDVPGFVLEPEFGFALLDQSHSLLNGALASLGVGYIVLAAGSETACINREAMRTIFGKSYQIEVT